jgi:hypothetical protein
MDWHINFLRYYISEMRLIMMCGDLHLSLILLHICEIGDSKMGWVVSFKKGRMALAMVYLFAIGWTKK